MKKIFLTYTAFMISISMYSQSLTPEVIASSGDYFISSNIKLNWTLGEMVTETFSAGGNFLTQGFHQSDYKVSSIDETSDNNQISIYPNPFSDVLTVSIGNLAGLYIQVFDLQGKTLMEKTIEKTNKQLDFSAFEQGIYFIKVFDKNKLLKIFKIQKITN